MYETEQLITEDLMRVKVLLLPVLLDLVQYFAIKYIHNP